VFIGLNAIYFSALSQNNQISEVTLEHLSRLQLLETLNLQNNQLTTQGTDEGVSGGQLKTAHDNLIQRESRMEDEEGWCCVWIPACGVNMKWKMFLFK